MRQTMRNTWGIIHSMTSGNEKQLILIHRGRLDYGTEGNDKMDSDKSSIDELVSTTFK